MMAGRFSAPMDHPTIEEEEEEEVDVASKGDSLDFQPRFTDPDDTSALEMVQGFDDDVYSMNNSNHAFSGLALLKASAAAAAHDGAEGHEGEEGGNDEGDHHPVHRERAPVQLSVHHSTGSPIKCFGGIQLFSPTVTSLFHHDHDDDDDHTHEGNARVGSDEDEDDDDVTDLVPMKGGTEESCDCVSEAASVSIQMIKETENGEQPPMVPLLTEKDIDFPENEPVRALNEASEVKVCFGGVHLMTPDHFEGNSTVDPSQNIDSSTPLRLSSLIHIMDRQLFMSPPEPSRKKALSSDSPENLSQCAEAETSPRGVLQMDKYMIHQHSPAQERSKLASSFRSNMRNVKVAYRLSAGRQGMSPRDKIYSRSLLPHSALLTPADLAETLSPRPAGSPDAGADSTGLDARSSISGRPKFCDSSSLAVLLVEPYRKVFEIVTVDLYHDTTVGDVLAKARANATDNLLSEQRYVSLCNDQEELAAPMLPVSLMFNRPGERSTPEVPPEDPEDALPFRFVMAIPEGGTASQVRRIRKALWQNPRIQRWLKKEDPFRPRRKETNRRYPATAVEARRSLDRHLTEM